MFRTFKDALRTGQIIAKNVNSIMYLVVLYIILIIWVFLFFVSSRASVCTWKTILGLKEAPKSDIAPG